MANAYQPTESDIYNVIQLLNDNGISVQNSKTAYEQLKSYQANPVFCVLLSKIFESPNCPAQTFPLGAPWIQYRLIAGITLKNSISSAKHLLGLDAVKEAARCALQTLVDSTDVKLSRVSAQIIVQVTLLTSFEWWSTSGLGDLAGLLLNTLLPAGQCKTLGALYCLQYIMEDLHKEIGLASENIIIKVSDLACNASAPVEIRKASFRMCYNIYEQSSLLEWDFDKLSPLQQGLVNASLPFARVCTTLLEQMSDDAAFSSVVFRGCGLLLDYFEYFAPMLTQADLSRMCKSWIGNAVNIICSVEVLTSETRELLSATLELLTYVLDIDYRETGESCLSLFSQQILGDVERLILKLTYYSQLSDDEVNNIMAMDDYRIRDNGVAKIRESKDISEDTALDDEETAMTLRRSALKCISSLCMHSGPSVCPYLFREIEKFWGNSDWRAREAGAVLIGTMATGCSDQLESFLPTISSQLLTFAENQNEHVCVSSISFWSISQLIEPILNYDINVFHTVISTIAPRMESTSKRIQVTSCSALNTAFTLMEGRDDYYILQQHIGEILKIAFVCVPVYTTQNLSLLVQLLAHIISYTDDAGALAGMKKYLEEERGRRAKLFEESYTRTFVSGEANALLDKDIFALDAVLLVLSSKVPDQTFCFSSLTTWSQVLNDVLQREGSEDKDLIMQVLTVCSGYVRSVSSQSLSEWLAQSQWELPALAFKVLSTFDSVAVSLSAINFLVILVQLARSKALPEGTCDALLKTLTAKDYDDSQLKEAQTRLVCYAIMSFKNFSDSAQTALQKCNSFLRSDVYGDSVYYYYQMSCHLCKILACSPSVLSMLNVPVLLTLLTKMDKSYEKSEATVELCTALVNYNDLASIIPLFLDLAISWTPVTHLHMFPGTREAIVSVFSVCNVQCQAAFHASMGCISEGMRNLIISTYLS
ncbi:transportin2-like protein [Angomonas deanei]|uniref:Importin N-terminal domain-containing protein n=1 Tax=Angomonas deanei TaxID=59799 RepID=A0A7G2C496_9TRYP|nr:transportin2-like protein [Angomonas deanei]CAD2214429.1 hypothetical protein, conserved [Angomonas deanei]|eukprot:EPY26242.1 transportin2-like protein [Angomonas deanei]